jgi:hypothetical protein
MIETLNQLDTDLFIFLNSLNNDLFDVIFLWVTEKYSWIFLYVIILGLLTRRYLNAGIETGFREGMGSGSGWKPVTGPGFCFRRYS